MVDGEVLNILRQRKVECGVYYGEDKKKYCEKEFKDYEEAAANFFQKCKQELLLTSILKMSMYLCQLLKSVCIERVLEELH